MWKNYLIIGWRNLIKSKLFSLINISGMAISIASFLIIALYILDELKFDKHINDLSRKYRVYIHQHSDDGRMKPSSMIPPMFGPTMQSELPEVESYTRMLSLGANVLFEFQDKKLMESKGVYVDPSIFDMFSLRLKEGDLKTALREPGTMAISETLAKKYFGEKPALNESLEVANEVFKVSAVYYDFPVHSHLQLNYMLSMENLYKEIPERMQRWSWQQFHTYIKVKEGTDPVVLEDKIQNMAQRYGWPATKPHGFYYNAFVMPMEKVHLHAGNQAWDIALKGNAQTVYILSATALFILLIAVLNFINLSTARAVSRVKEVGVRKVVGAIRSQLIYQFISESVIIAMIALFIAGLMTELAIPFLNSFTEKNIPTGVFLNPIIFASIVIFVLCLGIAAGAYPAFYISGYKPALILGSRNSPRSGKVMLRKALVVLQFVLSFILISAALIVSAQHEYMRTKDMGFDKDNVIILPLRGDMRNNLEAMKGMFTNHPNVINGSLGYGLPGEAYAGEVIKDRERNKDWSISMLITDHDYTETLGLQIIAGRDFSKEFTTDETQGFLVSESAAKMLGYQNAKDALEHKLGWTKWDDPEKTKEGRIIGVVKDFHLNSLRDNISPIIIHIYPFGYSTLSLRVKGEGLPETLAHLESTWKKFNTEWPFEYRFLDDNFDALYKTEQKLATLFTFFTGFTIFVACLGLFGLVVYSTTQKFKEISVRKVLGATEGILVFGLAKSYLLLIGIAFIIAVPFSYFAAHKWLEGFAFRIDITPMIFIQAGLFILVLALLTICIQSYKAARANPVKALKEQ